MVKDINTLCLLTTYVISLSNQIGNFTWAIGCLLEEFTSIERLQEYCQSKKYLENDAPRLLQTQRNWPQKGAIQVKNISVRYRSDLPLVLKNLSFEINPKEKIGVVGRTGSGKSTLLLVLMRVLELEEDNDESFIKIDGVQIGKIDIYRLRQAIEIIPQDPYLFEGTLKQNLDPFESSSKGEIEEVLKKVDFAETFRRLENPDETNSVANPKLGGEDSDFLGDLDSLSHADEALELKVEAGGRNFSKGQRQLICILRAVLAKPKILIMDEPTSRLDELTDQKVQELIFENLRSSTVITVAHRLETLDSYDRVLEFEDGVLVKQRVEIDEDKFEI